MRRLYFFTNSFPYGIGEDWKYNELEILSKKFDEIEIVPFHFDGNTQARVITFSNVKINQPLFADNSIRVTFSGVLALFKGRHIGYYLREYIMHSCLRGKKRHNAFFSDAIKTNRLVHHYSIQRIISHHKANDVFYFFWAKGSCLFVPVLRTMIVASVLVRFHGFDLYEYRNANYIPFRKPLLRSLTKALVISQNGVDYLIAKYPEFKHKVILNRLGTRSKGSSKTSSDGVFRLFSCSSLIPLKRVLLLASAIRELKMPVEWTHIGDGPQREELLKMSIGFPNNIQFKLTGWVDTAQVSTFYVNQMCDLFLNVSETEGLPVSIMEAYAASIPAYATNVGGVKEIVNSENGKLLVADISKSDLIEQLDQFYVLPTHRKLEMRNHAYYTYSKYFDAFKNAEELASICLQ